MIKPKKKGKKVKAPPFIKIEFGCVQDYGVYVIISNDIKIIINWLRSWLSDDISEKDFEGTRGICFRYNESWPVICLPYFPKTSREMGTLSHEAFHAVYGVCERIGIALNGASEEIFSRMISHVVTTVLDNKKKFVKMKGKK